MVPEVVAAVSERPTATSKRRVTRRADALFTGSSDAYAENWPMASNSSLELELLNIPHTPKNISKPSKSIKIKSLVLSTSFVSVSARLVKRPLIREDLNVIQNISPRRLMPHLLHQMVQNRTNLGGHSIQMIIIINQATT